MRSIVVASAHTLLGMRCAHPEFMSQRPSDDDPGIHVR
jgi:hypothetical protein